MPYKEVERQQNLFNQSHRVHITPLVIHGLGGGHTHTQTHTHAHTHTYIRTEVILRNQARAGLRPARAWFKNTLDEMEKMNVIQRADEPTEWVNFLVVIEKPNSQKIRICLDPRPLNKAIQKEHFQLPTIENITSRLTGAKVFSKLDANCGYWQIPLDDDSQLLKHSTVHSTDIAFNECLLESNQLRKYFKNE